MASKGRYRRLAWSGILVISLALPGSSDLAAQPTTSSNPAPQAAASEPKPYAMLASEPKPYAMLLAGVGLIVFIARRRTRALNAGG